MESFQLRSLVTAAALLALAGVVVAEEPRVPEEGGQAPGVTVTWGAALTSDYVFRGVSQSDGEPAAQGEVALDLGRGLYAGLWGSTVDFGPGGPGLELDATFGWAGAPAAGLDLDLALVRYAFEGEEPGYGALDYTELVGVLTWAGTLSLTVAATDDVYATGEPGLYLAFGGAWELGRGLSLEIAAGRSRYGSEAGYRDYTDGSVTLGRTIGAVRAALAWHATDGAASDNFGAAAGDRWVLRVALAG